MTSAAALVEGALDQPPEARLKRLQAALPDKWAGPLLRFRYVALALLINLPGNGLLGGGGGICLMTGLSRMFRRGATLLTIALAVLPVPLVVWGFDMKPWF